MSPSRRRASARCAAWHLAPPRRAPLAALHPRAPLCAPLLHPLITRAARWGHRALPPLHPQKSPPPPPPPPYPLHGAPHRLFRLASSAAPLQPRPCRAPRRKPSNRPRWLTAFVLLYIPPRRSLCSFVFTIRALHGRRDGCPPRCTPRPPFPSSCGLAVGRDVWPPPPVGAPHPPGSPHASLFLVPFGRI